MMGYNGVCGGYMMYWNPLLGILLIVAVVLLIIWFSKQRARLAGQGGESALDILKKRYARGEINRDEFERMKKDIS